MWTRSGLDGGSGKGEVEAGPEILVEERGRLMSHRFTHRSDENPRGAGVDASPSQAPESRHIRINRQVRIKRVNGGGMRNIVFGLQGRYRTETLMVRSPLSNFGRVANTGPNTILGCCIPPALILKSFSDRKAKKLFLLGFSTRLDLDRCSSVLSSTVNSFPTYSAWVST